MCAHLGHQQRSVFQQKAQMTAFHLVVWYQNCDSIKTAVLQSFGLTKALQHLENIPVVGCYIAYRDVVFPVGQYDC